MKNRLSVFISALLLSPQIRSYWFPTDSMPQLIWESNRKTGRQTRSVIADRIEQPVAILAHVLKKPLHQIFPLLEQTVARTFP
jgi:hypothetical protein